MLNIRLYHPTDESYVANEDEDDDIEPEKNVRQEKKLVVFEACLLQLLRLCSRCGQEVELNTSTMGTLLMVTGSCPDGHALKWQSQQILVLGIYW